MRISPNAKIDKNYVQAKYTFGLNCFKYRAFTF